MPPIDEPYRWEKPFLALQAGMFGFILQVERMPGIVQLAFYPALLAISLLNVPFVLTHWLIATVVEYLNPREIPLLSRDELLDWAQDLKALWKLRHQRLLECNLRERADEIALPVIDTLVEMIDALCDDNSDTERVSQIAMRLTSQPIRTFSEVNLLVQCVGRFLDGDCPELSVTRDIAAAQSEAENPDRTSDEDSHE